MGSYGKANPPSLSGFLYLSRKFLYCLHSICCFFLVIFEPCALASFSLCILRDTSDFSLRTEHCFGWFHWWNSIELFSDTRLFCSKALFVKPERVHVRIERAHLYKTQREKLYRQTSPGCWGRCLALLFLFIFQQIKADLCCYQSRAAGAKK